jgi:hypothetical protein
VHLSKGRIVEMMSMHLSKGRIVEMMSMFNSKEARYGTHKHIEHVYNSLKDICFNALSLPCVSLLSMCMDLKTVLFYHLRISKFISEKLLVTLAQFAHMQRK